MENETQLRVFLGSNETRGVCKAVKGSRRAFEASFGRLSPKLPRQWALIIRKINFRDSLLPPHSPIYWFFRPTPRLFP